MSSNDYDIAIAGGGLAGLSLAIQSARAGYKTILFEKEKYPFHKVCGEYISLESWNFLQELGVPLSDMQLPMIERLILSTPAGKYIEHPLQMGGFGISRYTLDNYLATIAKKEGVFILEETKVQDITYTNKRFIIHSNRGDTTSTIAAGAFGKRSNLDIRWKRNFITRRPNPLNHFIAVKYHVKIQHPDDLIALHNFAGGYCGISMIENNTCCLCYLTTASVLKKNRGNPKQLEQEVLMKNPFLKKIFTEAEFLYEEPLSISQVSFNRKNQVQDHVLLVGDACGLITPLCGNGMSMALHASKIAFEEIRQFLQKKINRFEMEQQYTQQWEQRFGRRMHTGRIIQRFFGGEWQSAFLIGVIRPFPRMINFLIRQTHGNPF